jgi:hypothetical protein
LSSHKGYITGGQNFTVKGHGFRNGNIKATLDGQDCKVTSYYDESFSCEVSAKDSESVTGVPVAGSNGIRRGISNRTAEGLDNVDIHNMD